MSTEFNILLQILGVSDLQSSLANNDPGPATRSVAGLTKRGLQLHAIDLVSDFSTDRVAGFRNNPEQIRDRLIQLDFANCEVTLIQTDPFHNQFIPPWQLIQERLRFWLDAQASRKDRDVKPIFHFQINGGSALTTCAMLTAGCSLLPHEQRNFWSVHPELEIKRVELPASLSV